MMRRDDSKLRVLVVDDEPLILFGISRCLEGIAMVKTVATAEEALEEIGAHHYDLCFLDLILPGMSGLKALGIINKISPNTKVAIMTGCTPDEVMKKQIEAGAYAFIEKPFEISSIMEVVNRAAAVPPS